MDEKCINCGNSVGCFSNLPLVLEDGTILCAECASAIQEDIKKLYSAKPLPFANIKNRIIKKSNELYSEEIQAKILSLIEKIGKESTCLANESTHSSAATTSGSTPAPQLTDTEKNFGGKVKLLAKATLWVEIVAAIITGICFMATDEDLLLLGLGIAAGGALVAYVSYILLSAYGQLVENSDKIATFLEKK